MQVCGYSSSAGCSTTVNCAEKRTLWQVGAAASARSSILNQLLRVIQVNSLQVAHSFLGVGAPEALLVGVVALVVFGPKGLADVRSLHLA